MTQSALLQDQNVKRFLAETSDEERARVIRIVSDLQLVASAMEFAKDRTKSSGRDPGDDAKKLFGEPLKAALDRLSKDATFLQMLMTRLGDKGFKAVTDSDMISPQAREHINNVAQKFPSLFSTLNDRLAGLAHSGTIMMDCGTAGIMMAGGALGAIVAAEVGGAGGMVGVFVGGAFFGAGAVYMSEYC